MLKLNYLLDSSMCKRIHKMIKSLKVFFGLQTMENLEMVFLSPTLPNQRSLPDLTSPRSQKIRLQPKENQSPFNVRLVEFLHL